MALAIKHLHNLPPFLSYVSTLPDIAQKPKRGSDELNQRLIDTWCYILQGIIDEAIDQWQTCLHACVNAKLHIFKTPTVISTHNWLFSELL